MALSKPADKARIANHQHMWQLLSRCVCRCTAQSYRQPIIFNQELRRIPRLLGTFLSASVPRIPSLSCMLQPVLTQIQGIQQKVQSSAHSGAVAEVPKTPLHMWRF